MIRKLSKYFILSPKKSLDNMVTATLKAHLRGDMTENCTNKSYSEFQNRNL